MGTGKDAFYAITGQAFEIELRKFDFIFLVKKIKKKIEGMLQIFSLESEKLKACHTK